MTFSQRLRTLFFGLAILAVGIGIWWLAHSPHRPLFVYSDLLSTDKKSKWQEVGGDWEFRGDTLQNLTGGRGDKIVVGSVLWSNYTVQSDVRFDTDPEGMHWGDAGVILRVTQPQVGVDSYRGYYVGISYEDDLLFIGRADYGWFRLGSVPLSFPVRISEWYKLSATVNGCSIKAAVQAEESAQVSTISLFDPECADRSGAAGARTFGVRARWRNFLISPVR